MNRPFFDAFRQGLRELDYQDRQEIVIEDRWAEGDNERFPGLLHELIQLKVDVIVVSSGSGAVAAKRATTTVPTVFFADDPVRLGLVTNLARPGGNMTGLTIPPYIELLGKEVQLLKFIIPKASRMALFQEQKGTWATSFNEWRGAARATGVRLELFEVQTPATSRGCLG